MKNMHRSLQNQHRWLQPKICVMHRNTSDYGNVQIWSIWHGLWRVSFWDGPEWFIEPIYGTILDWPQWNPFTEPICGCFGMFASFHEVLKIHVMQTVTQIIGQKAIQESSKTSVSTPARGFTSIYIYIYILYIYAYIYGIIETGRNRSHDRVRDVSLPRFDSELHCGLF